MTKSYMRRLISILLLLAFNNIYAATISARLDVNPVLINDTFHLTYTATGSVDDEPNFRPIEKIFEILNSQQSSNMSMINGNVSRSKTWTLTLLAKKSGRFIIPAISFGSDRAAPIKVTVKAIPVSNSATPNQNFILEMESSQASGFIQQQFIITVKLFVAQSINSYQFGDLTSSNPDTLIFQIAKDKQYKTYRRKKQYIVVEKKFALFPQKVETLKINPFVAGVSVPNASSNRGYFDPFNNRAKSKRLYSKAINLTIKEIPTQYSSQNWLPSSSMELKEEWPTNKSFTAGEPITRTLTLTAIGLTSAQLPDIKQATIDGLKQYPDKPETEEQQNTNGLIASHTQKFALIPTQAGSYTLPAVNIPWWNTKTNKMEITSIAKRTFTVAAATHSANTLPNTVIPQEIISPKEEDVVNTKQATQEKNPFWFWVSMLLLILWLSTLILWQRSKPKKHNNTVKDEITENVSNSLNKIKLACKNNDAQEVKTALLNWAKLVFTDVNNLSDIAAQVDEPLKQKINTLNEYLYSPQTTVWNCTKLYEECKRYKKSQTKKTKDKNSAILEPFKPSDSESH